MKHASALAAITNPTVNSYKRINAPRTMSGATWAPNTVTWTGNNRTHMVRVPGPGRFELRLPDGAANPYLLQAVIIAAGLDGIRTKADPGKRHDIDMYAEGHKVKNAPRLPLNMLDALRIFDKDKSLKDAMGEEFSPPTSSSSIRSGTPSSRTFRRGNAKTHSTSEPLTCGTVLAWTSGDDGWFPAAKSLMCIHEPDDAHNRTCVASPATCTRRADAASRAPQRTGLCAPPAH
jgi:hypothetical protein